LVVFGLVLTATLQLSLVNDIETISAGKSVSCGFRFGGTETSVVKCF